MKEEEEISRVSEHFLKRFSGVHAEVQLYNYLMFLIMNPPYTMTRDQSPFYKCDRVDYVGHDSASICACRHCTPLWMGTALSPCTAAPLLEQKSQSKAFNQGFQRDSTWYCVILDLRVQQRVWCCICFASFTRRIKARLGATYVFSISLTLKIAEGQ